jgi:hypothetical protein
MLDLSSAHLPRPVFHDLNGYDGVIAYRLSNGWQLWVPDDPAEHASNYGDPTEHDGVPPEVLLIQEYARAADCDYVLIDGDGPINPDLTSYAETWS